MRKTTSIYNQLNNKKKAFTLIELLIVIAIIGILFIVLVSKVDFATDKAKASGVQTDFRSFQMAFDTVAKENAGFNTFGFDMGDNGGGVAANGSITIKGKTYTYTNADKDKGDGIRNSYDEGDTNLDGKNVGETWTGRKVYTETWSDVWTLVKPGTSGYDADAIFALESAINKNLDPKLHITIASDGKITMANQARDPWKNEYHGYYITNAEVDKGDRGAIVMYSNGANGKLGSAHIIENGVVTVGVPGNNVDGQDDYSFVSCYTFVNGYGEVLNATTGFSNNQNFMANGNGGTIAVTPGQNNIYSQPGMYNENNELTTWTELVENGNVVVNGDCLLGVQNVVSGTLIIPEGIKVIDPYAFDGCSSIKAVVLPNGLETIGYGAFGNCTGLTSVTIPANCVINDEAFMHCTNLSKVTLGNNVTIGTRAFYNCSSLKNLVIPSGVSVGSMAFCENGLENVTMSATVKTLESLSFAACSRLQTINFEGTVEEWNTLTKEATWNADIGTYTVKCTNGTLNETGAPMV